MYIVVCVTLNYSEKQKSFSDKKQTSYSTFFLTSYGPAEKTLIKQKLYTTLYVLKEQLFKEDQIIKLKQFIIDADGNNFIENSTSVL